MSLDSHPYPSNFLALLSGSIAYVFAHVYAVVVEPPVWWQTIPLLAAIIAAAGPITVQRMKERYDGRLRTAQERNARLEAECAELRKRLVRTPEKDGMGL